MEAAPDSAMHPDDTLWTSLGSGALLAALISLVRLLVEFVQRRADRHQEQQDRHLAHTRDAEARLERILQDRLAEAERRCERSDLELQTERAHAGALQLEVARLVEAQRALEERYAHLQVDHGLLVREHQVLLERLEAEARPSRPTRAARDSGA